MTNRTRWLVFAIVAVGVAVRLAVYFHNRSLWIDEALLALNIVERSFGGLLSRLDCAQVAPPLFLAVSKLIYVLWGRLEYSLRLLPLLCSCLSLCLMARVLLQTTSRFFALSVLSMLAVGPAQIEWATSFKQYSADELSAVLVLMAAISWERLSKWTRFTVAAALPWLVWLSYTSVFVLSGLVIVAGISALKDNSRPKRAAFTALLCSMLAACDSVYVAAVRGSLGYEDMMAFWTASFPQSPYTEWLTKNLVDVVATASGLTAAPLLAFVLCVWGACAASRPGRWVLNLLAGGALASALAAAFLELYPFQAGRLTIYLAPAALLFLASGLDAAYHSLKPRLLSWAVKALAAVLVIVVLFGLINDCPRLIVRQEMRQVLEQVKEGVDAKAPFFVSVYSSPAFLLYAGAEMQKNTVWLQNLGLDSRQLVWAWFLAGKPIRFWVVVSHGDFQFASATFSDIEPFCMVKRCITGGASAACLLELRPELVRAGHGAKK